MTRGVRIYYSIAFVVMLAAGLTLYYLIETADDCLPLVDNKAGWQDVLQKWQQKKLVLLLRHTTKCDGNLDDCPTDDEYLTARGLEEAAIIGKGLPKLAGEYTAYHSPMSRTRDTADIAIGDKSQPRDWLATSCKANFPDYFYSLPLGSNYILVTHSNCFDIFKTEAGDFLLGFDSGRRFHFGIAAFFERFNDKDAELLGCVWPEDWEDLDAFHEDVDIM